MFSPQTSRDHMTWPRLPLPSGNSLKLAAAAFACGVAGTAVIMATWSGSPGSMSSRAEQPERAQLAAADPQVAPAGTETTNPSPAADTSVSRSPSSSPGRSTESNQPAPPPQPVSARQDTAERHSSKIRTNSNPQFANQPPRRRAVSRRAEARATKRRQRQSDERWARRGGDRDGDRQPTQLRRDDRGVATVQTYRLPDGRRVGVTQDYRAAGRGYYAEDMPAYRRPFFHSLRPPGLIPGGY
jgi:hypothetical protein